MVDTSKIRVITAASLIAVYIVLMLWTLTNVKLYVCDQKRYRTFSILVFYVLALLIEVSRMLMYCNVITIYDNNFDDTSMTWH